MRAATMCVLLAAISVALSFASAPLAGGSRDYPLTAKVLSVTHGEAIPSGGGSAGSQSGISVGGAYAMSPDREEVEIDGKIYTTEVVSHGSTSGHIGDTLPAAFGKRYGVKVIFVLGKDKDGKPKEITLRIISQRAAIPDSSLLRQGKGGLQATRAAFSSQNP
jgi:hypothetical protein